ncbi:MAG: hypothetical protein Q8R47_02815 [Nanoarchaeota archaeon]|nr:hypothetical protein [Nanoarchaeota archaeon]
MKKRVGLLVVIATIFVLVLGYTAFAVDKSDAVTAASNLTIGASSRFAAGSPGSRGAQGGNVTHINVTASRSTVKWAGFFGRVATSIKLGFSTDILYDFGNGNTSQIKTVFASPDTAFNFGNLVNATTAAVDSVWGFPQGHVDSATRTFTVSDQTVAQVSNVKAVGLFAYTAGNGTSGNSTLNSQIYNSSIFADTATPVSTFDFAFGTKVVLEQRDFRNQSVIDYELVVPVNTTGLGGVQTYFFFLDVE